MATKLHGLRESILRTAQIVNDEIVAVKIIRALKSATYIIRTESATMTPIETSTLINSQFDVIVHNGTRITGRIGYSADYAIYVHNSKGYAVGKSIPRPSGKGNYWDPHAEPKFLSKAAEKTKDLVDKAIMREMKL